jgi:sugar lactone lactonase YvrE
MKYTPGQGVTVFQENTNQANGLTRDQQGRIVACEHETRRVTRRELDGSLTLNTSSLTMERKHLHIRLACPHGRRLTERAGPRTLVNSCS